MPEPPTRVLITRPEPGASETACRITALGFTPLLAPLQAIEPVTPRLPDPRRVAGLVLTSGNAIAAIPPAWHAVPVWAVGGATARRARGAGFSEVGSADGDATALADLIAQSVPPATLLLATGQGVGGPIAAMLRERGFRVIRRVVYRARAADRLPDSVIQALTSGPSVTVLFFSAEAARVFVRLLTGAGLAGVTARHEAVSISRSASVALEGLRWRATRVSPTPNQDAMLAMLR